MATMVYGIYNYIVTGAYKPTNITGGPHIVGTGRWLDFCHPIDSSSWGWLHELHLSHNELDAEARDQGWQGCFQSPQCRNHEKKLPSGYDIHKAKKYHLLMTWLTVRHGIAAPNRNRWWTTGPYLGWPYEKWVDLSMANCECHNQMVCPIVSPSFAKRHVASARRQLQLLKPPCWPVMPVMHRKRSIHGELAKGIPPRFGSSP